MSSMVHSSLWEQKLILGAQYYWHSMVKRGRAPSPKLQASLKCMP